MYSHSNSLANHNLFIINDLQLLIYIFCPFSVDFVRKWERMVYNFKLFITLSAVGDQ